MTANLDRESNLLPDFLIIGAMKSGTTGLYDDLASHPDVYLPRIKEPDILHQAEKPEQLRALYRRHFSGARPGQIRGEASTKYSMVPWFPDVSHLARETLGADLKLVYVMRDPLARVISHLAHDYSAGRISSTDFDRLVRDEERYLALSDYAAQLSPWIKEFGTEHLLCLTFEDYLQNRRGVTRELAEFVGLDPNLLAARVDVSNPRGTARVARFGVVNRIIASPTYRYGIAHMLPRAIIERAKRLLTRQRKLPPVCLSEETRGRVRAHFADLGARLEALGVGRFEW